MSFGGVFFLYYRLMLLQLRGDVHTESPTQGKAPHKTPPGLLNTFPSLGLFNGLECNKGGVLLRFLRCQLPVYRCATPEVRLLSKPDLGLEEWL